MSAIIEPESASWHVCGDAFLLEATREGDLILHMKAGGVIAFGVDESEDLEAALLNARLWLERATKQADELKAAEEVEQGDHCARCDHPFHHGRRCDSCGCRVCHNCWHSDNVHTTNGCHAPACRCPISGELL